MQVPFIGLYGKRARLARARGANTGSGVWDLGYAGMDLRRHGQKAAAGITAPVGNLLGDKAMATRDIYNPGPGLKAFRHDLRLPMIRPAKMTRRAATSA
jgi:hypothetical protein